jgi:hypothetical protein
MIIGDERGFLSFEPFLRPAPDGEHVALILDGQIYAREGHPQAQQQHPSNHRRAPRSPPMMTMLRQ